jgi:hypothetical protein
MGGEAADGRGGATKISELMDGIRRLDIVLPEFQREYVDDGVARGYVSTSDHLNMMEGAISVLRRRYGDPVPRQAEPPAAGRTAAAAAVIRAGKRMQTALIGETSAVWLVLPPRFRAGRSAIVTGQNCS